uniref:F-box domain-containing protein n=1 Tax=Rhabditophanes sp. KR3021 TaxID=114890 RepID=A0AC35U3S7_9BILA
MNEESMVGLGDPLAIVLNNNNNFDSCFDKSDIATRESLALVCSDLQTVVNKNGLSLFEGRFSSDYNNIFHVSDSSINGSFFTFQFNSLLQFEYIAKCLVSYGLPTAQTLRITMHFNHIANKFDVMNMNNITHMFNGILGLTKELDTFVLDFPSDFPHILMPINDMVVVSPQAIGGEERYVVRLPPSNVFLLIKSQSLRKIALNIKNISNAVVALKCIQNSMEAIDVEIPKLEVINISVKEVFFVKGRSEGKFEEMFRAMQRINCSRLILELVVTDDSGLLQITKLVKDFTTNNPILKVRLCVNQPHNHLRMLTQNVKCKIDTLNTDCYSLNKCLDLYQGSPIFKNIRNLFVYYERVIHQPPDAMLKAASNLKYLKNLRLFDFSFYLNYKYEKVKIDSVKHFLCSLPKSIRTLKLKKFSFNVHDCGDKMALALPNLRELHLNYDANRNYNSHHANFFLSFRKLQYLCLNCTRHSVFNFPKSLRCLKINCNSQVMHPRGHQQHERTLNIEQFHTKSRSFRSTRMNNSLDINICNCNILKKPFKHIFAQRDHLDRITFIHFNAIRDLRLHKAITQRDSC